MIKQSESALPLGMCLGLAIGTAIGAATHNMGLWMPLGLAIGSCLALALTPALSRRKKDEDDRKTGSSPAQKDDT